ncbi:MAG: UDP-glucose 4-epimerase GalE [Bacteroidetes bacterium]|nr:UDP-glucose 4-epimerase GalE [Bacteroidota bacterium]
MNKKKRILVTGGTGYIGSHTAIELLKQDFEVVIMDNLSNSFDWIVNQIEEISKKKVDFHKIDMRDDRQMDSFFKQNHQFDGVIHFAALKSVGESVQIPNLYYHNNLVSLIHLLDNMQNHQIDNLIFSSSCTVYGEPDRVPITEEFPIKKAESPYGNTKQISEEIIQDNFNLSGMNAVSLRYFNPVGAHESGLLGELPLQKPESLMPVITQTCIGKRDQMMVHGNDYDTADGSAIRDYFHVTDLALAHVKALEFLWNKNNKSNFSIFNLGSEKGYSVFEVIHTFEEVNGVKVNYELGPRRKGDVSVVFADSSKALKDLGWKTSINLPEMTRSAWKWEKYLKSKSL